MAQASSTPTPTLSTDPTAVAPMQSSSFFQDFLVVQSGDLTELRAAAGANPRSATSDVQKLVDQVMSHYENYYRTKATCAHRDVSLMFSPPWTSSTEDLFMWAGGWRPSTAFHLLYSKCSLQLEARLEEILRGMQTVDLGNLSAAQLREVDSLQRWTIKREREITERWAMAQEDVAAKEMVAAAVAAAATAGEGMEGEMEGKRKEALRVLEQADQLRIETVKGIVRILGCHQAVHFLIAAAELHTALHEYGKVRDAAILDPSTVQVE